VERDLAIKIETHESEAWARCVEATGAMPDDPLAARVNRTLSVPLPALTAVDFGLFNRVIGLGIASPTSPGEIDQIADWYGAQHQSQFWVEVSPAARPDDLAALLTAHGLVDTGQRQAKVWREAAPIRLEQSSPTAIELGPNDRDAFAAVNIAAWGTPGALGAWFGATVGTPGFRHFGVREEGQIVSTGAMFVTDDVAWLGFGATLPEYRGRGFQGNTFARRINEAVAMGCSLIHTETGADTPEHPNASLHNMLRLGFTRIYEKAFFAPAGGV
jgi:GNAT superfamily N-acetyltransferase